MILTGVNMMGKKYVWNFWMVGLFCSMLFSENNVLWDFGMVIRPSDLQNNPKNTLHQYSTKQEVFQPKINAAITDPFVPPLRSTFPYEISDLWIHKLPESLTKLTSEKNIHHIGLMAEKYYIKKNYRYVIELLHKRDLSMLSRQERDDLEYLLACAFYHAGEYTKAQDKTLSLLKQSKSDRLCLLLAMVYESLGKNNIAKENYLKLIAQFPDSDYVITAKIKSRLLGQH